MEARLMLADALIASTALVWGLPLVTLNEKDFQFIQGLQISEIRLRIFESKIVNMYST
jgi:predicted nucleic acid-binding protein